MPGKKNISDAMNSKGPGDTRWITGSVALIAIAVFVILGGQLFSSFFDPRSSAPVDPRLNTAFLLNIALILFAWRRSVDLKNAFADRDVAETRAKWLAYYDEVTGLFNRRRLTEMTASLAANNVSNLALILIDLDNFKKINDLYGHKVGDDLLIVIAKRLLNICPADSTCVRLGGDEFAVLLQGGNARPQMAERLASDMLEALHKPMVLDKTTTIVGVSIGIAHRNKPSKDAGWLLRRADIAMYEAKRLGRNRCVTFTPQMEQELGRRDELEHQLREGLERREFVPFFQPIIDLSTNEVRGFEVLARWQHPGMGLIEPPSFLELSEATGTITDLSFQVMHAALTIARDWPSEYKIAVNLSPVQFNDPLVAQRVLKVLAETGFPASRLELEIMEKCLLENQEMSLATITSLKNSGISITVDDFGQGYAMLGQLRKLPFDRMKIDRSFIATLNEGEHGGALAQALSALGKKLKVPITAEGVETESVHEMLAGLGCADAQGWLFSRALSAEEVELGFIGDHRPNTQAARKA